MEEPKSLKDCEMRYPESGDCEIGLLNYLFDGNFDMEKLCKDNPNCYYKQLQKEKFENLNNRQMVESAENLIYENSELYKNLKEKEQECEELKNTVLTKCPNCNSEYLTPKGIELYEENQNLKQECEELKERASIAEDNFACEIQARLYHQNEWLKFSKECEELKKQLKTSEKWRINAESLNEKLDINNTRYRKALEEIEEFCITYSDNHDAYETVYRYILNIINKVKGE